MLRPVLFLRARFSKDLAPFENLGGKDDAYSTQESQINSF